MIALGPVILAIGAYVAGATLVIFSGTAVCTNPVSVFALGALLIARGMCISVGDATKIR